ncbi:hypothetical protein I204_04689 [Kwoniella mangroviensis CBS 8886]|nr:hypothetical protein I204_04689 [Kwoniella mangroviensis CBS 8886]
MGIMDKVKDVMPGNQSGSGGQHSEYSKPGNDDYNNPSYNQGMMGDNSQRGTSFESSRGSDLGMGSPNDTFSGAGGTGAGNTGRFADQGSGTGMGTTGYGNTRDDESGENMGMGMGGRTGQSGYGDDMDRSGNRMGMGRDDDNLNNMSGRGDMTGE